MLKKCVWQLMELCKVFGCTLDNLFREELGACDSAYSNLRVETVPAFRYVKHIVISSDPERDAIDRVYSIARQNGVEHLQAKIPSTNPI